jgi:hypothetical protein
MKIAPTTETNAPEQLSQPGRSARDAKNFTRVFQEELRHAAAPVPTTDNQALLAPLESAAQVPFTMLSSQPFGGNGPLEQVVDSTIGQLDRLEQLLQSPAATPKHVDDAVNSLSSAAEKLQTSLGDLPGAHPLHQIATEASVLAAVESMKWKRGDYL